MSHNMSFAFDNHGMQPQTCNLSFAHTEDATTNLQSVSAYSNLQRLESGVYILTFTGEPQHRFTPEAICSINDSLDQGMFFSNKVDFNYLKKLDIERAKVFTTMEYKSRIWNRKVYRSLKVLNLVRPIESVKKLAINLSLASDVPEYAFGDEKRLTQIILNIVGNAVKFSKEGNISITAFIAKSDFLKGLSGSRIFAYAQ
ncbi:hypothetical protein QQ045_025367 [Rhodiola kirilowii]